MVFICWRFLPLTELCLRNVCSDNCLSNQFTVFYPMIGNHSDAVIWNEIIRNYTGKNLFQEEKIFG